MSITIENNILPKGFLFNGISCGIKANNLLDLGIIYSSLPCVYGGVFTRSSLIAAPVKICKERLSNNINGVIVNSGNANALTGKRGMKDALDMAAIPEALFKTDASSFLSLSTGVIGEQLPMDNISGGIKSLVDMAKGGENDHTAFSESILTTDTCTKDASKLIKIAGKEVRIFAVAKGSGMIHPNMATMLSFITSDISISKVLLQKALEIAVADTFNLISVDGDQSTNDSVILLANAAAGNKTIESEGEDYLLFEEALLEVCLILAKKIVKDGEGLTKFVQIDIEGASSEEDAIDFGKAIASSVLVKTAFFGEDPNWGRVLAALGATGLRIDENSLELSLGNPPLKVFDRGEPTQCDSKELASRMLAKGIFISVNLNIGSHRKTVYTCDLSYEYVRINSEYTT